MNEEIQLEDFKIGFVALWKRKLLIVSVTILTTLVGLLYTFNDQVVNTYMAKTSIYSVSAQDKNNSSTLLISYADIITSNKVCERAASLLGSNVALDALAIQGMIGVNAINNSVVEIYAISTVPEISISVTKAVAEAFIREITSSTKIDTIKILDAAVNCTLNKNGAKDIIIKRVFFAIFGFACAAAYIVIKELLSKKISSVVQCIDKDEDEILGIIPYIE